VRRVLDLLPRGTLAVGAGLAVLGGASYVHLAIAGHVLSKADMASMSVLWSIVFSIGLGLFFPIEQEVTRIVAARRVAGEGTAPVYRRGAVLALALLVAAGLLLTIGAPPIADRLFNGQRGMVVVLVGAFAGLAVAHPTRGVLAGTGRFGAYGVQLGIDGGLRIVMAALLGAAGVRSPLLFGLILAVAPLISVLATAPPVRAALGRGGQLAWSAFGRGVVPLMISTLLAQLVVNVAVIDLKLLAPAQVALAGALLSALVLARVPLFVFASLQASLLPGLSTAAARGDRAGFRRLVLRGCGVVAVLAVLGGVPAVLLGPWLIRVLFAAANVLGAADFALLAAGTGAYLLAQVLGQGVLALGWHRDQTLAWLGGTVALAVITLLPGDVRLRVEAAYAIGSLVVALILAFALALRSRPGAATRTEPVPTALVALGGAD
jgi:O-antigen/teichoic acid export membrane protein